MSDTPTNPVMHQPKRMSKTAHFGIMAAMMSMGAGSTPWLGNSKQRCRHGKHHGRNPGAFGKQG